MDYLQQVKEEISDMEQEKSWNNRYKLRDRNKTAVKEEREMKKKRHYDRDCLFYFKHAKDEWVDVYEVYGYEEIEGEEEVKHSWCLPSLEAARQIVSDFKTRGVLADIGIRELQCYVDGAGLIWVKYVHYVPID